MAMQFPEAQKDEQWKEVCDQVKKTAQSEYEKLELAKQQKRKEKELRQQLPCLLMAGVKP